VDKASIFRLFPAMATPAEKTEKLTSPVSLLVDAILVIGFFLFIYSLVSTHVPSRDPKMILFFGASCAACMTGVFWLAIQMFRVVLRAQLAARK
jgi:hypothetical protein